MKTMDGLELGARLLGAMNTRSDRSGNRKDGKICDAKPGECRYNSKYYSLGMRDEKSWTMPSADDGCPKECPYLIE